MFKNAEVLFLDDDAIIDAIKFYLEHTKPICIIQGLKCTDVDLEVKRVDGEFYISAKASLVERKELFEIVTQEKLAAGAIEIALLNEGKEGFVSADLDGFSPRFDLDVDDEYDDEDDED